MNRFLVHPYFIMDDKIAKKRERCILYNLRQQEAHPQTYVFAKVNRYNLKSSIVIFFRLVFRENLASSS